jgi:hypothetical protein
MSRDVFLIAVYFQILIRLLSVGQVEGRKPRVRIAVRKNPLQKRPAKTLGNERFLKGFFSAEKSLVFPAPCLFLVKASCRPVGGEKKGRGEPRPSRNC